LDRDAAAWGGSFVHARAPNTGPKVCPATRMPRAKAASRPSSEHQSVRIWLNLLILLVKKHKHIPGR
jgi:hypothetical protein